MKEILKNSLILFSLLPASSQLAGASCLSVDSLSFVASDVMASTQLPPVHKWSFGECVDWACANTTDIRQNILDNLLAEQDVLISDDAWLPTVGFSTTHNYSNYPFHDNDQKGNIYSSSYGVNASWTAWEGNVRKYRQRNSRLLLQQNQLEGRDLERTIKLSVLQAYINILYAREAVDIAAQTLEVSVSQAKRAERLMDSGRLSRVDFVQMESQKEQDSYNLVLAQNNLKTTILALRNILQLGLGYDFDVRSVSFPDSEVLAVLPSKDEVYASAVGWLPAFKSNEINRQIYANEVKIAKAGYLPTIRVSGGIGTGYTSGGPSWGYQMGRGFGPNLGVSLDVPLFDGNATKRAVAKAKLSELETDIRYKNLTDELTQTLEALYIDSSNAKAAYSAGLSRLEAASLTNELTTRQFELGLVNPLELLTAHNNYLNARLEVLQNKYMAILANKSIDFYNNGEVALP